MDPVERSLRSLQGSLIVKLSIDNIFIERLGFKASALELCYVYKYILPAKCTDRKRSSATNYSALKRRHSDNRYSCQLEIDHVTQQPKETCKRTCNFAIIITK